MDNQEAIAKIKAAQAEIRQIMANAMDEAIKTAERLMEDVLLSSTLIEVTDEFNDRHFGLANGFLRVEDNGDLKALVKNGGADSTRYFLVDEITKLFGQQFAIKVLDDEPELKEIIDPYPPGNPHATRVI